MSLKALIVDDEEPALSELSYMLYESSEFERIDTSQTAIEALKLLRQTRYDVVFLDIQMPGLTGIELMNVLTEFSAPPLVVFVTAYDEYAVKAFELQTLDYLLKPISFQRLVKTIELVKTRVAGTPDRTQEQKSAKERLEMLPVEREGKTILVDLSEIRFAVAQGDHVQVKTRSQAYFSRFSIADLEKRLPSPPFLKTHRAYLVNLRNVVEIYPYFNGAFVLKVNDNDSTEIPVSRGHAKNLRALLGM
ncbi:MAG: LytTR family DNA-binding domain-containing protein [Chloroflexi bacterium]|nr:LytTR family DNA-binding domain-containing protein [Chloroflexota bacterium]MDA8187084.1 LytTR family DNA-binding domain-containing protein [Dehalococcoidales bacterium]